MNKYGIYRKFLFLIIIIYSFTIKLPIKAQSHNVSKNVVIINSYERGMAWADNQTEVIISELKKYDPYINLSVEYMDWKRFPNDTIKEAFYEMVKLKYTEQKTDLIISIDDAALEFCLKYREELFDNGPIVFTGVNDESVGNLIQDSENITGIIEFVDVKGTVKAALKINPNLKKIYLVNDNTESGRTTSSIAIKAIRELNKNLIVEPLNDLAQSDIIRLLSKDEKNSIILTGTFFSDINNDFVDNQYFTKLISINSNIPIYHLYGFSATSGVVGGSMICGDRLGLETAELAKKVLEGEDPSNLPIASTKSNHYIFDYEQLDRFNIPLTAIPEGSTLLNNPFKTWEEYKDLIITIALVILILLTLVIFLIIYLRKVKKMKRQVENNHEELAALYEELSSTEEELREQYLAITEAQDSLLESEQRYKLIVEATNDAIWDWNLITNEIYFSEKFQELTGYDKSFFSSKDTNFKSLIHPDEVDGIMTQLHLYLAQKINKFECEYRLKVKDKGYKWFYSRAKAIFNEEGKPIRVVGSNADISFIKSHEEELIHLAYHDQLTGLYNRSYFNEQFSLVADENLNVSSLQAFLFIDMDNFKLINDTLGHAYGDKVITETSKKLYPFMKEDTVLFRIGGDEFLLYLKHAIDKKHVESMAKEILKTFTSPVVVDDNSLNITVSIGIALAPKDSRTADGLLKCADMATYKSKENGKNTYCFFSPTITEQINHRVNIERNLKNALKNKEFFLMYQPQINIKTNEVYGFEALIRWQSKELGLVPPYKFIGITEETGFIVSLGEWILKTACKFAHKLNEDLKASYKVSVNISVIQILQKDFCDRFLEILKETELPPSLLQLEITESTIMESPDFITGKLQILRSHGITVAIDDFGTGYSSLGYLRNLPIDLIKIDKLFIDDIIEENSKNIITDSIISLCHKIGLPIISEGVETIDQVDYLRENNCDIIQGYYFSKPLASEDVYKFLKKFSSDNTTN